MGRPSLAPGRYFRLLLLGYFEGIDSERGIAWRAMDSLAVRGFLGLTVHDAPPDHSTISRTRRLIDLETHRVVFTWVQERLVEAQLLKGKTIGIDATTLEANAAHAYPIDWPLEGRLETTRSPPLTSEYAPPKFAYAVTCTRYAAAELAFVFSR